MKRLVALALCAMMAIGLCACGDSAASGTGAADDAAAAVTAEAEAAVDDAAAEEGEEAAPAEVDESLIAADGINVCIASEPDNIDPALNRSSTLLQVLQSGSRLMTVPLPSPLTVSKSW